MAKTSKGIIAAEIGTALAAAAAGYYFYGSKRAKKHRDVVARELKTDWKLIQKELKKIDTTPIKKRATQVGERALTKGRKTVKKLVKQAKTAANKKF